jgi:hypothetical protein
LNVVVAAHDAILAYNIYILAVINVLADHSGKAV